MITPTGAWDYKKINRTRDNTFDEGVAEYLCGLLETNPLLPVMDFGCGIASYLFHLKTKIKNLDVTGVEPTVIDHKNLEIPLQNLITLDLSVPIDLNKRGHVMCIEVLEHIPAEYEKAAVDNLIKHCSDYLIISWAGIGQHGHGHVNCKDPSDVLDLFQNKGFVFLQKETDEIRKSATLGWLKKNLIVFRK